MQTTMTSPMSRSAPDLRTLALLAAGGCAGLGFWEAWAATVTSWAAGFPLQPPELIKSLFSNQLGVSVSNEWAALLHALTGIVGYPIGYFILTRHIKSFGWPADGWIWGVITYFIALGFFAPLAGQHFLLRDVPVLSFMSLIGHAIYGWLAAWVFEKLNAQGA